MSAWQKHSLRMEITNGQRKSWTGVWTSRQIRNCLSITMCPEFHTPEKRVTVIHQTGIIESYYQCGATEKANKILIEYADILKQDLEYYGSLSQRFKNRFANEFYQSQGIYEELVRLAKAYDQKAIADQL